MGETIARWSFSSLVTYESCPLAAKKKYIDRLETKQHPAAERGNQIHLAAEEFIRAESSELPKVLEPYRRLLEELQEGYAAKRVLVEGEWGFTKNWEPTGYSADDCWVRGKLDVMQFLSENKARGRDWKTGKQYPPKHLQQEQLYTVFIFAKYEHISELDFIFDYVDQKPPFNKTHRTYAREKSFDRLRDAFTKRGQTMTQDTTFNPRPSVMTCRRCDFKETCEWAVT